MNKFDKKIEAINPHLLYCETLDTLQVNLGFRCNHSCSHCHLRASPQRHEKMTTDTMNKIIRLLDAHHFQLVDITGGAPELHSCFLDFIQNIRNKNHTVQIRTNLTALNTHDINKITSFFADYKIHIVASLPCYLEENVDKQRGLGVFQKSIKNLQLLNTLGYGIDDSLPLYIVHNPLDASLPAAQSCLENAYRKELASKYKISFTKLFTITNMPIGRFNDLLIKEQKRLEYLDLLQSSFNPATAENIMCRNQISIGWDGTLYDCDFNLALGLRVDKKYGQTLDEFDFDTLDKRRIITGEHCFGCTAGHGSSCGGALTE